MNIPFERSFASHEKSKYWSSKNTEKPENVFKCSGKKYWFECDCGHTFDSQLNDITRGKWCPYCVNRKLCNESSCLSCYNNSFASHEKSKYWGSKNTEQPRDVFKSSHKKFWFDCDCCKHTFDSVLSDITRGGWCSYCSNPPKRLCNESSCLSCYDKSFASHEKSKYWSSRNIEHPRDVFKGVSTKQFSFDCDCGHTFDSQLNNINKGSWCPYCSNHKLCNESSCLVCYNKSFASHAKSKYWSNQNTEQQRDVFKCSGKKYWFDCDCGHIFDSVLASITSSGTWCPHCVNKTETKLYENISQIYPTLQHGFRQDWCKKINHCPYDFCIPEHKIIIELDGPQHFRQIAKRRSPEDEFENDKFKEDCANQNDYSVIRLLQEDVWYDRYDWIKKLCERIEEIKASGEITNIYISNNNEYGQF